jgi:hypothetical protein
MCLVKPEDSFWTEKKIPVSERTKLGIDKHHKTIAGWITNGCKSPVTGDVVQLEGCYVGRELHTTREAYQRFLQKLNNYEPGDE